MWSTRADAGRRSRAPGTVTPAGHRGDARPSSQHTWPPTLRRNPHQSALVEPVLHDRLSSCGLRSSSVFRQGGFLVSRTCKMSHLHHWPRQHGICYDRLPERLAHLSAPRPRSDGRLRKRSIRAIMDLGDSGRHRLRLLIASFLGTHHANGYLRYPCGMHGLPLFCWSVPLDDLPADRAHECSVRSCNCCRSGTAEYDFDNRWDLRAHHRRQDEEGHLRLRSHLVGLRNALLLRSFSLPSDDASSYSASWALRFCYDATSCAQPLWTTMRMVNGAVLAGVVRLVITVSLIGNVFFSTLEFRHLLCGFIGTFLASVPWTPRFRRNLLAWIFNGSNSAAQRKEAKAAAAIAAMVGKLGRGRALSLARENFRALSVATLDVTDLNSNTDAHDLFKRTSKAKLGEVDAFMSHSWSDAGAPKFSMLKSWADQNDVTSLWLGRESSTNDHMGELDPSKLSRTSYSPTPTPDPRCARKGLHQPRSIEESLACLPVFLSGCRSCSSSPVLAVTRLWRISNCTRSSGCATLKRIQFLPIPSSATDASETHQRCLGWSAADYFASFDVRHARCWQKDAEQHLPA